MPAPGNSKSRAERSALLMSDEMVQEKTEGAAGAAPDGTSAIGAPVGDAQADSVSSSVAAPAATEEPAPAQSGAPHAASDSSVPSTPASGSAPGEFERAMQDYDKQ